MAKKKQQQPATDTSSQQPPVKTGGLGYPKKPTAPAQDQNKRDQQY
jgi:hypothetical protein